MIVRVHLFNHALMKSGLFLVLACVLLRVGSTRVEAMRGLGRTMPLTMAAFVVAGLSMIGVPGTVGFISKWYLVTGALERGLWWVAVLILLSSLLALVYIWRRSLVAPMTMHFLQDFLAIVLLPYLGLR